MILVIFCLLMQRKIFYVIRPRGNPIDAIGFVEMSTSGHVSDGYCDF